MHRTLAVAVLAILALAPAAVSFGQDGQADLAKAIELKLTAQSLAELGEVIQFCEGALSNGLPDEADQKFARQLLAGTLLQRAEAISPGLLQVQQPPAPAMARQLAQLRQVALSDLRRAVEQDPDLADAQLLLARLESPPGGDRARARQAADRAVELFQDDPLELAKALTIRAALQDDPAQQKADFDRAVELAPRDIEARRARGASLVERGEFALALADLDAVLELDNSLASAYESRGIARLGLRQVDGALADLNRAIELSPQSPLAHFHRARAQLALRHSQEALDDVNAALAAVPDNLAALLLRAACYRELNEPDKALADLERILQARPGLPQALRGRADVRVSQGKWAEAIGDLEAARQTQPNDLELLISLGSVYSQAGQGEKSVETYTAALAINDQVALLHQARGDVLLGLGRQQEALADYEAALKIDPESTGVLNNLAWLLATSTNEALRNGTRAIELAAQAGELTQYQQPNILSTLAAAHAEAGHFDEAIEWSEKAVALAEGPSRAALEKELASYREHKPWREAVVPAPPAAETPAAAENAPAAPESAPPADAAAPAAPSETAPGSSGQ